MRSSSFLRMALGEKGLAKYALAPNPSARAGVVGSASALTTRIGSERKRGASHELKESLVYAQIVFGGRYQPGDGIVDHHADVKICALPVEVLHYLIVLV